MAKSRKRTTPAKAAPVEPATTLIAPIDTAPIEQTIALRAYELFLLRGATHGDDWQDWLTAERELTTIGLTAAALTDANSYAG